MNESFGFASLRSNITLAITVKMEISNTFLKSRLSVPMLFLTTTRGGDIIHKIVEHNTNCPVRNKTVLFAFGNGT